MNLHSVRRSGLNTALGVLLALGLLFTQWLGYAHAIAHAGLQGEQEIVASTQGDGFGHAKSASACAALDAVALGVGMQTALPAPLASSAADGIPAHPLRTGWRVPFNAPFSSRAPPLNA